MRFANTALMMLSLVFALAVAELFLWVVYPLRDPFGYQKTLVFAPYVPSYRAPSTTWVFRAETGLPGMRNDPVRFTANNLGFRGDSLVTPKPPSEMRIFMVGGSTTECLILDDADAITSILQQRLARRGFPNVRVYGAGKSGDRSYDHVALMVHRVVHLEPDLVIVFAGVNDLLAGINNVDYLHLRRNDTSGKQRRVEALAMLATELQLPRLIGAALKRRSYRNEAENVTWESNVRRMVNLRSALPVAKSPLLPAPDAYARNLMTIAGVAKAHHVPLVFMTQATSWNSAIDHAVEQWHWMNAGSEARFTAEWMDAAMEIYNDAMREVGTRHQVPIFDLAAEIPKSLEFFYDDVHFNIRGADEAGRMLSEFLVAANSSLFEIEKQQLFAREHTSMGVAHIPHSVRSH
jgi:lysophospholipase L1-like esterase